MAIKCPHCGSSAQVKTRDKIQISNNHLYVIDPYICGCGCQFDVLHSREENKQIIIEKGKEDK